jgi:site-specific DNA recombinase
MLYTYDNVTKEIRTQEAQIKKQLTVLDSKIEAIEERFAIGTIDCAIYKKFKAKYSAEHTEISSNLNDETLSSSNLETAIDLALKISSNITDLWTSGDLKQKKKIQNLIFPSGIGYDKQNNKVRTNRVNALFSSIPLISKGIAALKNGEPIPMNQFSVCVTSTGFKPVTS